MREQAWSRFGSSTTNPENGTTTYTYSANDQVASRTDAKNQTVTYQYDAYERLISKGGGGQTTNFYYDAPVYNTGCGTNAAGRVAEVRQTSPGAAGTGLTFTECYSDTNAGR